MQARVKSDLADTISLKAAVAELDLAKLKEKNYGKYSAPRERMKLEAEVELAQLKSMIGRALHESAVALARSRLAASQARRDAEAQRLDDLKDQLNHCHVKAPHDGIVHAGPVAIRKGSRVRRGQVVMVLVPDGKVQEEK